MNIATIYVQRVCLICGKFRDTGNHRRDHRGGAQAMSINRRQANLLKTLVSTTSYLPTATLAGELSCSERTVRNDVAAINAFLEQNGLAARTASKRGTGIQLNPSPAERERILGLVKERALALDPALDRFYRGILLLICDYNGDYTVESLARAILTNK